MGRTFPRFGVIVSSVNSELAGADLLVCFSLRLDQLYQFFAGGEISLLEGVADSLNQPGLAELLRHPGDYSQFIQANSLANFSIIARGAISSNPGDLFLNSTFEKTLAQFRQEFDYILIGSSPMFAADDATTLAPKVDGTLFVVRSRFSRVRAVREALNLLNQRQTRVLGLVLNRADATARSYHYYNYAEYYPAVKSA
jgi:capsular exopolysaccharide synthesis family protein